jgi:hypothetical protein
MQLEPFVLDSLETLYGAFNLHPAFSMMELGEEWKECFRADGKLQSELKQSQPFREWSASYLDSLETLYGEFNLHPQLSVQELCEEWQKCFMPSHYEMVFER